jgi:hypothetical protein
MLAVRRSTLHFFVFGEIKLIGGVCRKISAESSVRDILISESGEGNTGKTGIPVV